MHRHAHAQYFYDADEDENTDYFARCIFHELLYVTAWLLIERAHYLSRPFSDTVVAAIFYFCE